MGSFYEDFKKKQNRNNNKTSALLKVPQVVPKKPVQQPQKPSNNTNRNTNHNTNRNTNRNTVQQNRSNNQQRNTRASVSAGANSRSTSGGMNGSLGMSFGVNSSKPNTGLLNGSLGSSFGVNNGQLFSAKNAAQQRRNPQKNVSTGNKSKQSSGNGNPTLTQLLKNSMDWHKTSDPNKKAQLHAQNNALRQKLGYQYNAQSGASYDKYGHEMTAGVRMAYGSTPTERLNQATQLLHTSGVMGQKDKVTVYPTAMQAAQGLDEDYFKGQTGVNAHKAMRDLFNRSDETWSKEDTQTRDRARQELSDEMSRILKQYGLAYQPRDNADDIMNRLKAAGADEQTLAYVQENIDLRHAADRLGNSLEAVGKRWAASLPSLKDTAQQVSANVEESRQNEEYRQLEEQEQTLELTLQGMNSTAADGSVPADYQAVYDQLQEVRKRKNELTVNKGVDPNKWSQRMLREANEAQANAEAGLAPAPRWLTEQGISLAGNAPTMAASAIPVVGPAASAIIMGGQAAGQRSFELNEQGKGARESLTRGMASGAIEAASERLPLGQMSKILHSGGKNAVKNILIQMGEEATEESASYFMNYVADLAANDPDAKFSLQELAQSAAGGVFGGLVYGTAGALGSRAATDTERVNAADAYDYNQVQELVQLDSELQAALKLPEGPIRERAVQAAQNKMVDKISGLMTQQAAENAELTANYDADLSNRMSLEQRAQAAEWEQQHTTSIDTNPATHTPEQMIKINEYVNSVDEGLKDYTQRVLNGESINTAYDLKPVSTRAAQDILNTIGVDATGFQTKIEPRMIEHIARRHGTQGAADTSMADMNDIARMQYVMDNYDEIADGGRVPSYKEPKGDGSGRSRQAASVIYQKQVDGTYYVVQAVPDTKKRTTYIVSAYMQKNEGSKIPIAPNGVSGSTQGTASMIPQDETVPFMTGTKMGYPSDTVSPNGSDISSIDNSIRQNTENSNTSGENIPLNELMQYGKTPEQAAMEANAKAEGERVRAEREAEQAAEQEERLDRITNGKSRDIMQRVYEAQERAERVASRHTLERATTRATASDADSYIDHTQEDIAIDLVNSLESERRFLTNLRNGWHLSDAELVNAERMAAGRGPVTEMDSHRYELVETYARAMRQYNEDMQPYYAFQRGLDDARLRRATELIKDSDNWKDSRGNLGLQIRTPERVLRKVMGDTAETEAIYQAYFAPIFKHDAEAVRWENTQRERLKGIMEGLSHEDSVYIHMKNRAELSPKNGAMQKQLADYVKENKSKIHFKQAENAMQQLYEMTSEMHPQISEAGVRNGYAPLEYRQKYIPSLTPTKEGKWYNRILRKVGVETMVDELPTEIAGRTEDRRPGRQYAGFYNQREGINTEFDAFKAMDNYISGASNAIFHTDDIQNLRTLEDAIRSKYSDEGSRAEIEALRKDPDINIEDKEQKISKIWERNSGTLPSFPSWIAEYTNILAGKKSRTDRSAEQMFGRGLYRAMSDVEGKVAADMVGGNLSTALSNFIPLMQGSGEVRYSSMMRAMLDYGTDLAKKNPAFHEESDFLTNRRGSERVIKTKLEKASDAASWAMNSVDNLASEVMVRARYLDNVEKRHMSTEAALNEADRWAAGLIGDRAKGAKPIIMESKSPLIKAFTMFQLEVMNQYDHLFSDIPHYLRAQGKSKAQIVAGTASALLQVFVMSHLFNDAREKLTGSRGAFDPIEMVNDFVGRLTGYALPNVFDLLGEMMGDGIDEDDFRAEKSETAWDNVKATAQDVASNIPFVSGPLGALAGAGNSRLPIQSVIPNIDNIMTAQGEEARSAALKKELTKPIYGFLLPFGGLQAKKTVEGAATMFAGGSYSYDKKGEKILQFPTYGQKPADWAQALLFGKSSSDEARAWRESGYESLNADETKVFDTLSKSADNDPEARKNIYDAIIALHDVQSDTDENGQLLDNEGEKKRRMLFENDKLTESQKTAIDREIIVNTAGGSTADYSDETSFEISTEVRKKMQGAAHQAAESGLAVSTFAQYDNTLKELTEGTDENGEKLHTADEARGLVLDAIEQDSSLSDGEKQTLADYLLVSSMSESAREKWNDEVKGKVNASDYVRFKADVAAYEAEFKGTGADNVANVTNILNSYTNLTDEQKSVLMNTYNDTAKNDVFHVSSYEQALADNSYYKSLNDSEKSKLRAYCNEYERAIADGKELSGWKAKAYMAKEAGIEPGTYALFQTALSLINADGGNAKNEEITQAVKLVPGLTDSQRAYLWQAAYGKDSTKSNPWGGATVTKYQKSENSVVNPVDGGTISSGFGWRQSFQTSGGASSSNHRAIDIAAPQGTPVKAAMSGKVVGINKYGFGENEYEGYGVSVTVDCGNGITMAYHHMVDGSNADLNIGDEVKAGQQIGQVGSTGKSTGPHLDFQVVKDGKYVDPRNYIPGYGEGTSETISAAQAAVAASSGSGKSSKKSSGGSRKSGGGSSSGGLKQLKGLSGLKGLG